MDDKSDEVPSTAEALRTWAQVGSSIGFGFGAALALRPWSPERAHEIERATCRRVLEAANVTLRIDDRTGLRPEDDRPRLFVHLDQQTLLAIALYPLIFRRQFSLIVNIEFALLPIIGWLTVADGAVILVRQWPAQARAGMKKAVRRMREGESFGISIEGRRSIDGGLSPYKKGPILLAIEAQCDIVPFMTHGEWSLWPRGQWKVRPGTVDAVLYPPISTRGLTIDDRDDVIARLRDLAVRERALRQLAASSDPSTTTPSR